MDSTKNHGTTKISKARVDHTETSGRNINPSKMSSAMVLYLDVGYTSHES